jgi:hypothetical protein
MEARVDIDLVDASSDALAYTLRGVALHRLADDAAFASPSASASLDGARSDGETVR